jgi:16S rRNA processing protein RimM
LDKRLVLIGEIVRAQGIRGKIKVRPLADPDAFSSLRFIYLGKSEDLSVSFRVVSCQPHKGFILLGLGGITTMSQAEDLAGSHIYADSDALKELPEGEYYYFEIIGLDVLTDDGRCLGKVEEIFPTGSNDVYVVRDGKREYLIPAIEDVVREIDIPGGRMVIHPIEGLLGEE